MSEQDIKYMSRALELARLGAGCVSPNPMVGCVIVKDDKIIGEGYHRKYGGPHAEVNAVKDVRDPALLAGSTAYVTLEPCAHQGKTPPCANLLVDKKVKKVIISNVDPNPLVAGKGIEILRNADIEVETDLLKEEGLELNKQFFTFFNKKRPYIILKWAETADGFVARENYDSKWISNTYSRMLVHKWRAEEDAILVGKNTALHDDPTLNVRDWEGKDPLRIVIDHHLKLENSPLKLFDGSISTICYNLHKDHEAGNLIHVKCSKDTFMEELLADLYHRKILSLIVEGGAATLNTFINASLWDEARVFRSGQCFGSGISAPKLIHAGIVNREMIMGDELVYFHNNT